MQAKRELSITWARCFLAVFSFAFVILAGCVNSTEPGTSHGVESHGSVFQLQNSGSREIEFTISVEENALEVFKESVAVPAGETVVQSWIGGALGADTNVTLHTSAFIATDSPLPPEVYSASFRLATHFTYAPSECQDLAESWSIVNAWYTKSGALPDGTNFIASEGLAWETDIVVCANDESD